MNSPNSFGNLFRMTTFGESHGAAVGVVVEGCPAGVVWMPEYFDDFLERRRPGRYPWLSARQESDRPEILSGVYEGTTLGSPVAMIVRNVDVRSEDYKPLLTKARTGHADDVWKEKFGHSDLRGGGRASGRETLARVMAGALAKTFVKQELPASEVESKVLRVGPLSAEAENFERDLEKLLTTAKEEGESYGGLAEIKIKSAPVGLGEPVFLKLKSDLARAFMTVGAVVGVELGDGFSCSEKMGTKFHLTPGVYGGIRGGISTGEDILFRIAVKPTSSILDFAKKGRHDPCIVLRALVVFEAMAWLVLADQLLYRRLNQAAQYP